MCIVLDPPSSLPPFQGVIARSIYWLAYYKPTQIEARHNQRQFSGDLAPAIGGAFVESWVYFWYLATYFWTFFFAVDVYNSKHGGKWKLWCSHTFTWSFCSVYVAGSVAALWAYPPQTSCTDAPIDVISHFLCTFGPIVVFMIALPIFYMSAWKQMKKAAEVAPAVDIWKTEKKVSRRKILSIILVFYLCWLVNIVDGVVLITIHALQDSTQGEAFTLYNWLYSYQYIYTVWLLEAILNPLQGLFNAVAYGNLGVACYGWLRQLCLRRSAVGHFSGEYIDVDFRVGRGNIHSSKTSKRRNSNT
jgi:ocular albinism type 1 protein